MAGPGEGLMLERRTPPRQRRVPAERLRRSRRERPRPVRDRAELECTEQLTRPELPHPPRERPPATGGVPATRPVARPPSHRVRAEAAQDPQRQGEGNRFPAEVLASRD